MHDKLMTLRRALRTFVEFQGKTQSQKHIKQLHWHIAERLVIEGGFNPDHITPRPPLRVETSRKGRSIRHNLVHDPTVAVEGESTILGGLKTKDVDVVVSIPGIGPCVAISVKGTLSAFRNLTNRMEEAAGDCTNIHIAYPNLIYGFFHVIRGGFEGKVRKPNDIAIHSDGRIAEGVVRYHDAMERLAGRQDVRNDVSRYEAVSLAIIDVQDPGVILSAFPARNSEILHSKFFETILRHYDLRYTYAAPALRQRTQRFEWASDSDVLRAPGAESFAPRLAN